MRRLPTLGIEIITKGLEKPTVESSEESKKGININKCIRAMPLSNKIFKACQDPFAEEEEEETVLQVSLGKHTQTE